MNAGIIPFENHENWYNAAKLYFMYLHRLNETNEKLFQRAKRIGKFNRSTTIKIMSSRLKRKILLIFGTKKFPHMGINVT